MVCGPSLDRSSVCIIASAALLAISLSALPTAAPSVEPIRNHLAPSSVASKGQRSRSDVAVSTVLCHGHNCHSCSRMRQSYYRNVDTVSYTCLAGGGDAGDAHGRRERHCPGARPAARALLPGKALSSSDAVTYDWQRIASADRLPLPSRCLLYLCIVWTLHVEVLLLVATC